MNPQAAVSNPTPPVGSLAAWKIATRPKTLPAAIAPIIVGTAVAVHEGGFHLVTALVALMVALLLQIASNFANDVLDFKKGADTHERLGPTRVTLAGLLPERQVRVATGLALLLAMALGLYLVWRGGWPILVLGALAMVSAVAYTGGPAPLGYLGLGEVFVFLFFGLAGVAGTAYLQTGHLTGLALAASVPVGALVTNILVVNNLRDVGTDRAAGKRTLAARFGERFARLEYVALLAAAFAVPGALWIAGSIGSFFWLPWLTLPLAVPMARDAFRLDGRALNPFLGRTARFALLFAVPFAGSILL